VAGHADRAALARQRRLRVVAGPLAQRPEVRALHHHVGAVERRHPQSPDGVALPVATGLEARELRQAPADVALPGHHLLVGDQVLVQTVELVAQRRLVPPGHESRDRLLPGQRQSRIEQEKDSAAHQDRRDEVEDGA
jgi:hypothetical protein